MAIPNGDIYLLRNVPLTASYEHTIDFKTKEEQYTYFYSFVKKIFGNYSYIRKEREYIAVELPVADLDDINYLLFRSKDGERLYYAFVTNKVYVNPTTTAVYYSIDVMQTYMFDYQFRESFIKQAHVDRWGADHKPIYSLTEEDLSYGTEYTIDKAYKIQQEDDLRWLLVCMKDYSAILESGNDVAYSKSYPVGPPFTYFLIPFSIKAEGSTVTVSGSGIEGNKPIATFNMFLKVMSLSAIGNYIHSVNVLPYAPFVETVSREVSGSGLYSFNVNLRTFTIPTYGLVEFKDDISYDIIFPFLMIRTMNFYSANKSVLARADWDIGLTDLMPTAEQWTEVKKNPRTTKRDKRFESKLLCAPYRYNLLTDWRNDPVIFKNEYMTTDKIEIMFSYVFSDKTPFRYWIKDYKRDPEGRYTSLMQAIAPEYPIISDAYYTYMLENKNTIQANLMNAKISAVAGTVSGSVEGAVGGAIAGGPIGAGVGAGLGAFSGIVGGVTNVTNLIRSENAKQKDLKAKPDSVISSNDGCFNVVDGTDVITFYRMGICCENENIIANIFNMTGYKVNRVEVPNTRSRVRFNYIQTGGANIVGSFNQEDLLKIKSIYDNGITIWHYSEQDFNPLDYSYENIEVNLL